MSREGWTIQRLSDKLRGPDVIQAVHDQCGTYTRINVELEDRLGDFLAEHEARCEGDR